MSSVVATAQFEITPSLELEDLFLHFSARVGRVPAPRSLVEAGFTDKEIEELREWFVERWELPFWCDDRLRQEAAAGASRQEMIGALILILATAQCREHADEDSVWPAVTKAFRSSKGYPALFVAGQPTAPCKRAMAAGVRRLGLRNLIDRQGKQEYFDTLRLQFGFTRRGAEKRLAEWLAGFVPLPVKILSGEDLECIDLRSESFSVLWKALKKFRDNHVAREYTRLVLEASPWVRHDWIEGLLEVAAKGRPSRVSDSLPAQEVNGGVRASVAERLCEPILEWPEDSGPRLILRLADARMLEILGDSAAVEICIDAKTVDRWTLQEGGGWRGKRSIHCPNFGAKANLRPKVLLIKAPDGAILHEVDLREVGLAEPVVIFDLISGDVVDAGNRFDRSLEYGFVCDADLSVEGASQQIAVHGGWAYRTGRPWGEDLKITCDGALYWLPRIGDRRVPAPIRLSMKFFGSAPVEVGSAAKILLSGVPNDAKSVRLRVGRADYDLVRDGDDWLTDRAVTAGAELAVGEELVRAQVIAANYSRSATPALDLSLVGIARQESLQDGGLRWDLVKLDRPLERADGIGKARVFAGAADVSLFEGFCRVSKTTERALDIRDLQGWGAPLSTGSRYLVKSVEDRGRFRFFPSLFRGQTKDLAVWRVPTPPLDGHRIVVWSEVTERPREFDCKKVVSDKDGIVWTLPVLGKTVACAIMYSGLRLGSWFGGDAASFLKARPSPQLFAVLRWLKMPVLKGALSVAVREAINRDPAAFIKGWLDKGALPSMFVHRDGEDGLESVVREFLWDYSERGASRVESLLAAFPKHSSYRDQSDVEVFTSDLARFVDEYPAVAYSLARLRFGNKYRKCIRAVVESLLSQPQPMAIGNAIRRASDECARLVGITGQEMESAAVAFAGHLDGRGACQRSQNFYLRRLGETVNGRRFLSSALLLRLLEGRAE
jgi:hypothetical protein